MTNLSRSICCDESVSRPGHDGPWYCDNCGGEAYGKDARRTRAIRDNAPMAPDTTRMKAADLEAGMVLVAIAPATMAGKWHQATGTADPITARTWNQQGDQTYVRIDTESGTTWNVPQDRLVLIVTPEPDADPDTLFLSRAAAHVVAAEARVDEAAKDGDPDKGWVTTSAAWEFRFVLNLWQDLTGLDRDDALAYAHRVHTTPGEVTAHVAPF